MHSIEIRSAQLGLHCHCTSCRMEQQYSNMSIYALEVFSLLFEQKCKNQIESTRLESNQIKSNQIKGMFNVENFILYLSISRFDVCIRECMCVGFQRSICTQYPIHFGQKKKEREEEISLFGITTTFSISISFILYFVSLRFLVSLFRNFACVVQYRFVPCFFTQQPNNKNGQIIRFRCVLITRNVGDHLKSYRLVKP